MEGKTFKDLELEGWIARAERYDSLFGKITHKAIDPILDTFGDLKGKAFLEVACGTGHLTAAAHERGAKAEGIDFAETMLELASMLHPQISFKKDDAEALSYDDDSFDAVANSFGILHFEHPDKAIEESFRVLKSDGRFTFTAWCSGEQGGDFFALVMGAVMKHGKLDVGLPSAPPLFRFADFEECAKTLETVGFTSVRSEIVPIVWQTDDAQTILDLIYKSVVRTPMLLNRQTDEARETIHKAILEGAENYRQGGTIVMRFPVAVTTATKA